MRLIQQHPGGAGYLLKERVSGDQLLELVSLDQPRRHALPRGQDNRGRASRHTDDRDVGRGRWPLEFFAGTLGCPDPASDQIASCFGIRHDFLLRLAVIPVGKTTLLAWARTSQAHPDEAFFAMFERMLNSVRFR